MQSLQEKMEETSDFLCGIELVSTRGSMAEAGALKARDFANQLVDCARVDWVSITDNAGGNPMMAPTALGKPILYAGKEVVIHLTCKDANRNGLESEAWSLASEGFHNILAMTGDYPVAGNEGWARPVFDIDSVGLLSMLDKMNRGLDPDEERPARARRRQLGKTQFFAGAVTTNFKLREGEVIPQYLKLEKKIECGARFIINQIGYDARKMHELSLYLARKQAGHIPLIGNVFVLTAGAARIFHKRKIPGVVVTDPLLDLCLKQAESPDKGKAFFLELAAKQVAIYRGLGYRGAYLGGVHSILDVNTILETERSFSADDWKAFARELRFSRPGEFYLMAEDPATGLADGNRLSPEYQESLDARKPSRGKPMSYRFSKFTHRTMFTPGKPMARWGAHVCANAANPSQGPRSLRVLEHLSKSMVFGCKDCGDCALPDTAYLCPESQCAKNQRNGPCGGTREGQCEVKGYGECIWLRAYERLKADGGEQGLLSHAPVIQNQGLRGTSSWANHWLGRDHAGRRSNGRTSDTRSPQEIEP